MIKESTLQLTVTRWLNEAGYLWWRMALGGMLREVGGKKWLVPNGLAGFPDLCGVLKCRAGVMWAMELKAVNGRLSEAQKGWRDRLKSAGVVWGLVRGLDEARAMLEQAEATSF